MYFAPGYTAIQGREGEGTEELGIPSSMKFPYHEGTLLKQAKDDCLLKKKALLKSRTQSLQVLPLGHKLIDFLSYLTAVSLQDL